jgi:hypothetical protein
MRQQKRFLMLATVFKLKNIMFSAELAQVTVISENR